MGFLIKVTEKETRRLTFRRRHFHDFRPCSQLRVEANGRGGRGAGGAGGGARHPASSGGKERRWLTRATRRRRLGRGEIWSTAHDGSGFRKHFSTSKLDGRFFWFLRNCIFGTDPTILLDFTSNLGSIVPLFQVEKIRKIYYFALIFSHTEL